MQRFLKQKVFVLYVAFAEPIFGVSELLVEFYLLAEGLDEVAYVFGFAVVFDIILEHFDPLLPLLHPLTYLHAQLYVIIALHPLGILIAIVRSLLLFGNTALCLSAVIIRQLCL